MQIVALALAALEALPILDRWFQLLMAAYVSTRISSMKAEHRATIKKAIDEQDQRDLEKAIGSPDAGEPSGIPGTERRDTLPGVH